MNAYRPAWLEISPANLQYNCETVKKLVGDQVKVCAVVKANGYGHGAVEVSKACLAAGADFLAVAMLSEAMELREAGFSCPILILGWTPEEGYEQAIDNDIRLAMFDRAEAQRLSAKAQAMGKKALVHLKLDTGMSRIGFQANEAGLLTAQAIMELPGVIVEGIFSHFSKADEADKTFARNQLTTFKKFNEDLQARTGVRIPIQHMAASSGIIDLPEGHLDMVRPGIMLYGFQPSSEMHNVADLKPALTWKARVARVQQLPKGRLIGYNGTFELKEDTLVATVPVGYADGYNRLLSNFGYVICRGKKLPIIGRVCMDQFMIDTSQLPDMRTGDTVTLLGEDGDVSITVTEMASMLKTIEHEIVCGIAPRVPKFYVDENF